MQCPQCNQENPDSTARCICGFNFPAGPKGNASNAQKFPGLKKSASRKVISVLLFVISLLLLPIIYYTPSAFLYEYREGLLERADYIKFVVYPLLFLTIAICSVWGGIRLNARWRSALGGVCLVFGGMTLVSLLERTKDNFAGSVFISSEGSIFIPYALIYVPLGAYLLIVQRRRDKKKENARAAGKKDGPHLNDSFY